MPWLYMPFLAEDYRLLPLDFVTAAGYWLHVEGDSTITRGEKVCMRHSI